MTRPNPARRTAEDDSLSIYPHQVHIGDRFTDADTEDAAHEWEVVSRPVTFKKGHEVRARVQRPGDPATAREKYWAAHEKSRSGVERAASCDASSSRLQRRALAGGLLGRECFRPTLGVRDGTLGAGKPGEAGGQDEGE